MSAILIFASVTEESLAYPWNHSLHCYQLEKEFGSWRRRRPMGWGVMTHPQSLGLRVSGCRILHSVVYETNEWRMLLWEVLVVAVAVRGGVASGRHHAPGVSSGTRGFNRAEQQGGRSMLEVEPTSGEVEWAIQENLGPLEKLYLWTRRRWMSTKFAPVQERENKWKNFVQGVESGLGWGQREDGLRRRQLAELRRKEQAPAAVRESLVKRTLFASGPLSFPSPPDVSLLELPPGESSSCLPESSSMHTVPTSETLYTVNFPTLSPLSTTVNLQLSSPLLTIPSVVFSKQTVSPSTGYMPSAEVPCYGTSVKWEYGCPAKTYPFHYHILKAAKDPAPTTPWNYLSREQLLQRLKARTDECRQLRKKHIAVSDYKNTSRVLQVTLKNRSSPAAAISKLQDAISRKYTPHPGVDEFALDLGCLVKAIGGTKLLFALNRGLSLPSYRTVGRHQKQTY
ncbi:hypothetical protein BJ322DRAFT_1018054 [Thelephora terrestris]|uniref:Uncharacterized protein n=1 Tax=Thelephora terrestris TaxID=56493 RepID=A0A9P6HKF5_9AGAM|nr:hypothetical protein BJ322DRAFT_1018054 [Thelephora terrestris]